MLKFILIIVFFSFTNYSYCEELDNLLEEIKSSSENIEGTSTDNPDVLDSFSIPKDKDKDLDDDIDKQLDEIDTKSASNKQSEPDANKKEDDDFEYEYVEVEEDDHDSKTLTWREKSIAKFYSGKQRMSDKEWTDRIGSSFEEVYVIAEGDTLWSISDKFLDSPWYWPKIWELNSYITNPHLIFPGNEIRFSFSVDEGPSIELVAGEPVESEIQEEKEVDYSVLEREVKESVFTDKGFYKPSVAEFDNKKEIKNIVSGGNIFLGSDPSYFGTITGAYTSASFLYTGDKVELSLNGGQTCSNGARISAIEATNAPIYQVLADLKMIKPLGSNKCLAKVVSLYGVLRRNSKITTPVLQDYNVARSERDIISGRVYQFDDAGKKLAGEGERIFIKFNSDAPIPGTIVYIYEIKDPYTNSQTDPFIIGVAKLIHSNGHYSTASIVASNNIITQKSTVVTRF